MVETNVKIGSLWKQMVKIVRQVIKGIQKQLRIFGSDYPYIAQIIQLTFIYFFACIDLIYSVLNNVFTLGYMPELLLPFFPFIKYVLQSPYFKIWASPEKVFFLSYLVIELMVVRSIFKFSKLVKYNILLIFSLLMFQGLVISYWDLLFHREISTSLAKWAYGREGVISSDKSLAITFFFNTFVVFLTAYLYLYIRAIQGKFATLPAMEWLTDSVAFWLRIKTPTMRFGKDKDQDKEEKKQK
jgi:hypothetical protein